MNKNSRSCLYKYRVSLLTGQYIIQRRKHGFWNWFFQRWQYLEELTFYNEKEDAQDAIKEFSKEDNLILNIQ